MSQCLIIFKPSGVVEYQRNNKIYPFNEFILHIINETQTSLDANFTTQTIHQKRFYCFHKEDVYVALYFDAITAIDSDKVRQTLYGIHKIYKKFEDDDLRSTAEGAKFEQLVDLQFNNLMKLKRNEEGPRVAAAAPVVNVSNSGTASTTSAPAKQPNLNKRPTSKKLRKWDDSGEMIIDVGDSGPLDYSRNDENGDMSNLMPEMRINNESAFTKSNELVLVSELNEILGASDDDDNDDDDEDDSNTDGKDKGLSSGFFSRISSYLGGSINLEEVSKKFNDQLISKNIAPGTAKLIIDKIKSRLAGKTVTMTTYKQILTEELTKILTPNVSTDLLYEIKRNSGGGGKPFVISVVGVNGVGKSTNLAKLAYWFLQNNLNVLICACDTFRSGAVEQLKVHVNNLDRLNSNLSNKSKIEIFEKGYGGGDHVVTTAKQAIEYARTNQYDIVLIDTAGRTHSNAKLMAPLKKFGDVVNPDRIIMVGEALVGTDSVEQAMNFNQAFGNKRSLDFFIISKVDTVGDMVGTTINMVMATKVPILFVGTGQTYTDIKRLSVRQVVEMLMK
ncbi:SRP101 [Candida oxycetoniae]|uniref:Signal recognition particle receptor subunit alpha homolog n=1 Tax=Candida oxycetoniae TaxID=497107 RepID=A0AAI9SX74_9ASCO|nr:SRP101 [Candida oxycetoniae]KAI3404749.1 SRP101 [Candida oxycetoniae]